MQDKPRSGAEHPNTASDTPTDEAGGVSRSPEHQDEVVIPVVAEGVSVETARVARGAVRVHKRVETNEQTVATPLVHEEVVVERVRVDRPVEGAAPEPHEEDGVLVIPVLEEIAVVERRLVLREEVRVSRRRTTTTASQVVTLRREVADVERVEPEMGATTGTAAGDAERAHPGGDPKRDSADQKKEKKGCSI